MAERFARIVSGAVAELRQFDRTPDPNPRKGLDWRPCPHTVPPPHDPDVDVLEGPTYDVRPGVVNEQWSVRSKTAPEVDADKAAKLDAADLALIRTCIVLLKLAFNHENRIRALEGKPNVTIQQFVGAVVEADWPSALTQYKAFLKELL